MFLIEMETKQIQLFKYKFGIYILTMKQNVIFYSYQAKTKQRLHSNFVEHNLQQLSK